MALFRKRAKAGTQRGTQSRRLVYAPCNACGRSEYLPYNCSYCGGVFCSSHHLPADHDCSRPKEKLNVFHYAPD